MLEIINGIEPEAWAGLAGLLGGVATAVVVVSKGLKKSPPEVGTSKPEADMTEEGGGEAEDDSDYSSTDEIKQILTKNDALGIRLNL